MKASKEIVIKASIMILLPIILTLLILFLYREFFYGNNFINKIVLKKDMDLKYFIWAEFDSKVGKDDKSLKSYYKKGSFYIENSGKNNVNKESARKLDLARDIIERGWNTLNPTKKIYFVVNSAFRSDSHNEKVGGVLNSAHRNKVDGSHAFDISWSKYNEEQRKEIEKALREAGFNRIGKYDTFIHADDDSTLPNPANW